MHPPLFGKTLAELSQTAKELSLPAFSARQMADWLYVKNVSSIDEMTNLSAKARALLSENYSIGACKPLAVQTSADGTKKYLFPVLGGNSPLIQNTKQPQ